MDGKLFLGTARFLRHNGLDEAAYRSAISRAYYACFIATRSIAYNACKDVSLKEKTGIYNEEKIRHENLRNYLKNSSKTEIQKLASDLFSLSGNRNDADYKMGKEITVDDAQSAIEEAEAFFESLANTPKEDIGKAMEECLRKTYP